MNLSKNSFNRRDFVKSGVAAVVGTTLANQFPGSANAFYGVDDTIKVGLIGCGGRGTGAALQALSAAPNTKLVAMADAFSDRIDESIHNMLNPEEMDDAMIDIITRIDLPAEHLFDGFDGYKQVIAMSDVIILTTPPAFRPIHFEAAVDAGKQIFMEKPVATDAPGIRRVLAAAEKAKEKQLNVVVGLQRRYQTQYLRWIEMIHSGAIGDIIMGRVYWNSGGVWVRSRSEYEEKAGRPLTEMEYQMRNWYYFNWLCGDHIVEQHIHNIDVGNWVKQAHPIRAQGQGGRQVRTELDHGEIYDHHFVEFEYADGSRVMSQCRHIPNCMNRVSEAFHGTSGYAPYPGEIYNSAGEPLLKHDSSEDPNPYQQEHDELFAAINAGQYKYADAENGAIATMSAILGRMATYSGNVVTWEEAMASELDLMPEQFAWDADPPVLPNAEGRYEIPTPGVNMAY
ncbi:MAG: Gfo/Idh/MocA family oxidoreductase [Bacteroidetes bacterium]|nr:Gfo/Idh/MocA family oxidoreductase [Bacteroidota bacterium]